jgi:hypothetical protein
MSSHFEIAVDILAAPDRIWATLIAVEKWPEWTASVKSALRLDGAAFGLGSEIRMQQPKLATTVWRVTNFRPEEAFTWEAKSVGARTIAEHKVIQKAANDCTVVLTIRQTGFLIPILSPFISKLTRRYMQMEAQGLKQRCEDPSISL